MDTRAKVYFVVAIVVVFAAYLLGGPKYAWRAALFFLAGYAAGLLALAAEDVCAKRAFSWRNKDLQKKQGVNMCMGPGKSWTRMRNV